MNNLYINISDDFAPLKINPVTRIITNLIRNPIHDMYCKQNITQMQ